MRTTVTLAADVSAAVRAMQREKGLGVSAAVEELVRRGLHAPAAAASFTQTTSALGLRVDVRNVAVALELLDGDE